MKVWVVVSYWCEETNVLGVFSDKEKAETFKDGQPAWPGYSYAVLEYTLDDESDADPVAQAEIDRLRDGIFNLDRGYRNEINRLRACSDPTPPAEGERHTAEQLWHHLLEASSHRRLYVLNQLIEAQDDALRCFLQHDEVDV